MMEEVTRLVNLEIVLCKHESVEEEIRERSVKSRQVIGAVERVMKGRGVRIEVKMGIRDSVILPIMQYPSETWL